eukprot:COSAG05_NODE_6016_length_1040_cov_6595.470776_1_plen_152_part_00
MTVVVDATLSAVPPTHNSGFCSVAVAATERAGLAALSCPSPWSGWRRAVFHFAAGDCSRFFPLRLFFGSVFLFLLRYTPSVVYSQVYLIVQYQLASIVDTSIYILQYQLYLRVYNTGPYGDGHLYAINWCLRMCLYMCVLVSSFCWPYAAI